MIAPDPHLVRRLRTRVRAAVQASPALRRERKRMRPGWLRRHIAWRSLRFLGPVIVLAAGLNDVPPDRLSALLVLWSALVLLYRAGQLTTAINAPALLWVFFHQPVPNLEAFRHQERPVLRSSCWLFADWFAFGLVVALRSPSFAAWCAVPFLAAAQWAAGLGLAATLVRWRPRLPYAAAATLLSVVFFLAVRTFEAPAVFVGYNAPFLRAFTLATPAGWIAQAHARLLAGELVGWLGLPALGAAAIWLLRWQRAALRDAFSLERVFHYDSHAPAAGETARWISADAAPHDAPPDNDEPLEPARSPTPVSSAALSAALHHALVQPDGLALFNRGFLERTITRLLSARQRVLVDFLQPRGFGWTRGWLLALALIVVARLLQTAGASGALPALIALIAAGLFALPLFGGTWHGFDAPGGLHSNAPLGFGETARLLLAVSALRTAAALPLILLAARFALTDTPLPWGDAFAGMVRMCVAVLALQPFWVMCAFSKNSNDSSARWWFTALLVLGLVGGLILVGTIGAILFAVEEMSPALISSAVLLGATHAGLLSYGWAYNRGIFDLIARTRAS